MVVKNNMSAVNTLGVLNRNSAALAKSLGKVSSGQKINSAADDASGYAISERMRVMIRSLDQADQNAKNGASMMKVAEGAVSSTVDILRTMKEKAINAANDSNTDADRAAIQKELDQSIDQVDDNALITYNGKTLVDGSKMAKGVATKTSLTNQSLHESTDGSTKLVDLKNRNGEGLNIQTTDTLTISYVIQGRNYSVDVKIDGDTTLDSALEAAQEPYTENSPLLDEARATRDAAYAAAQAVYDAAELSARNTRDAAISTATTTRNDAVSAASTTLSTSLSGAVDSYQTAVYDANNSTVSYSTINGSLSTLVAIASTDIIDAPVAYNYWNEPNSTMNANAGNASYDFARDVGVATPNWIYDSVNSMSRYLSRATVSTNAADYSTTAAKASGEYNRLSTLLDDKLSDALNQYNSDVATANTEYNASTSAANADYAASTNAARDVYNASTNLARSVYNSSKAEALSTYQESQGDIIPYKLPVSASNVVGKDAAGDTVYTANREKALTITTATGGLKYQLSGLTFSVKDSQGKVKKSVNAVLDNFNESVRALNKSNDNAINLQVGTKANQTIRISLTDMRSEALGLKSSDGETISVATQKNANAAINVLDNAIQKALDQQTDIGAVQARLEMTSSNLVLSSQNVQASESVIRDADMAKEMTEFTKNNILLQAAQSMLAQANQSSSNVLSLLQ